MVTPLDFVQNLKRPHTIYTRVRIRAEPHGRVRWNSQAQGEHSGVGTLPRLVADVEGRERLASLRDAGVLIDDEFSDQLDEILGDDEGDD